MSLLPKIKIIQSEFVIIFLFFEFFLSINFQGFLGGEKFKIFSYFLWQLSFCHFIALSLLSFLPSHPSLPPSHWFCGCFHSPSRLSAPAGITEWHFGLLLFSDVGDTTDPHTEGLDGFSSVFVCITKSLSHFLPQQQNHSLPYFSASFH